MKPALHRLLGAALGVLLLPASVPAGSIGFRTDAEVRAGSRAGVDVKVTVTHTGDETASDVSVALELDGSVVLGQAVASIRPAASHVWELRVAEDAPAGVHAVVVRVRYSDQNGYPFEVVSLATATVDVEAAPRIFGTLEVPRLSGKAAETGKLTLKRPPGRSGDVDVRIVAPSGLEVEPSSLRLSFGASARTTADLRVRNLKLLPGTTVNVYALVESGDPGFRQVDTVRGNVHVTAASSRVSAPRFYEAAAAMAGLLVLLEAGSRLWARRRQGLPA